MNASNNGFWKSLLGILACFGAIATALSAAFAIARELRPFLARRHWFRRHRDLAVPDRKQAKQFERLVRHLGKAQEWLGNVDCEMARRLARELGHIEWKVWAEALSYIALFSRSKEQQCLALRNLSQVEYHGTVARVKAVVQGVKDNPFTDDRVKRVAEAALLELEKREKIKNQKQPTIPQ